MGKSFIIVKGIFHCHVWLPEGKPHQSGDSHWPEFLVSSLPSLAPQLGWAQLGVITYDTWNSRNWIFPLKPPFKGDVPLLCLPENTHRAVKFAGSMFRNCQTLIDHKPMKIQGFVPRVWLYPKVGDTAIAKRENDEKHWNISSHTTLET